MKPISAAALKNAADVRHWAMDTFGLALSRFAALDAYVNRLQHWNRRINLVSEGDTDRIWTRHIADSLQLLRYIDGRVPVILDVGSGAGLPGLVIAIARTGEADVHLVEKNRKKVAFLRDVARLTRTPVTVHACPVEIFDPRALERPPVYVTARALAPLTDLLALTARFIAEGAVGLFIKGQHVDIELTSATKSWTMDYDLHKSEIDPSGAILVVREAKRVG